MQTEKTQKRLVVYILLLLCLLMTAANIYLLRANRTLRISSSWSPLKVEVTRGVLVKAVSGLDFENRTVDIPTFGKKATVLMCFSPVCPFCEKNWPSWSLLINSVGDKNVNFVVVDLTSDATPEFLASKHIGRAQVIHRLNPQDVVTLDLALTPQTVVIGGDSKVEKVWTGVLSADDLRSLTTLLKS
jgi:thiol-disulfide isomerase/thioredoxin